MKVKNNIEPPARKRTILALDTATKCALLRPLHHCSLFVRTLTAGVLFVCRLSWHSLSGTNSVCAVVAL